MVTQKANGEERVQLLERLSYRRLGSDDFVSDDDLVVGKESLVLDEKCQQFKPLLFKPSSLEDLIIAVGPRPEARKNTSGYVFRLQRELLLRMSHEIRPRRYFSDGEERKRQRDEATYSNLLTRAVVSGALPIEEIRKFATHEGIIERINNLEICRWLWPNIIVRAGATLTFNGPGVQTIHAYKLTVEPGGRIVLNNAPVMFDCVHLEVQE